VTLWAETGWVRLYVTLWAETGCDLSQGMFTAGYQGSTEHWKGLFLYLPLATKL